ncbi:MAG: hypothetical protein JSR58_03010 [Verrucomicrobia bacterium]|nr:hypothetical protein [Verrucomicrobiota bacterium]
MKVIAPDLEKPSNLSIDVLTHLIDRFKSSLEFIDWISNGCYERKIIHNHVQDGKHTHISMFYVEERLILTCRTEISLPLLTQDRVHFLSKSMRNEPVSFPYPFDYQKNTLNTVVCEPYYTAISQYIVKNEVVGMSWEIFELPNLWDLHLSRNEHR